MATKKKLDAKHKNTTKDKMNLAVADMRSTNQPSIEKKYTGSTNTPDKQHKRKNSFAKHSAKVGKKCK